MMGNSDIVGSVDGVGLDQVDGWAYREGVPAEHLSVSVQLDGVTIGTAVADAYRVDLQEGGIGDGDHAYSIKLDRELSDEERGHVVVLASSSHGDGFEIPLPAANQEGVEEEAAEEEGAPAVAPGQGTLYAESAPLLAPVGYPADFIDDEALANARSWVDVDLEVLKEAIRRDVFAIPHSFNREGYADGFDLTFWLSGYVDYLSLQSIAAEYGVNGGRFFDFGGSTGRVFRHFVVQSDAWDVWSSDFKTSSFEFNLKYFPKNVRVFLNTSLPSLPIPDSYFDFIAACSVFTHIDETESGWLLELRRVLRPGGIACLSIHSKETWASMDGELQADVARYRPDIADERELPEGKTVVTFRSDDPYRCQTFHSDDYIHLNWGRFFEILEIRPLTLGQQAMVVLRRAD